MPVISSPGDEEQQTEHTQCGKSHDNQLLFVLVRQISRTILSPIRGNFLAHKKRAHLMICPLAVSIPVSLLFTNTSACVLCFKYICCHSNFMSTTDREFHLCFIYVSNRGKATSSYHRICITVMTTRTRKNRKRCLGLIIKTILPSKWQNGFIILPFYKSVSICTNLKLCD